MGSDDGLKAEREAKILLYSRNAGCFTEDKAEVLLRVCPPRSNKRSLLPPGETCLRSFRAYRCASRSFPNEGEAVCAQCAAR